MLLWPRIASGTRRACGIDRFVGGGNAHRIVDHRRNSTRSGGAEGFLGLARDESERKFNSEVAEIKAKYEKALEKWKDNVQQAKAAAKRLPDKPIDPVGWHAITTNVGGLFNGKIAPLAPYAIRGAIWYQGESNASVEKALFYQYQLPLMIREWRKLWNQGDFPFAWVQLPNFKPPFNLLPTVGSSSARQCLSRS